MKTIFTAIFSIVLGVAYAQDFTVTEQFASEDEAVTARSMGLAGAFGAVGADFSNATSNPAGMAFFRKKEIGFGVGYQARKVDASYLGQDQKDENSIGQLNNIGLNFSQLQTKWVGDSLVVKKTGLVSWNFALGMNQKADYNENISFTGLNSNNSLISSFVQTANQNIGLGYPLDAYESQASQLQLMSYNSTGNYYSSPFSSGNMMQTGNVDRRGARRDIFFSGGLNFENKLYLGATFGIPWINYQEVKTWTEVDEQMVYSELNSFNVEERQKYTGTGGNFGIGAIYRFTDYFRIGGHVRTPSSIDFTQNTTVTTGVDYTNYQNTVSDDFQTEYTMDLPLNAGLQLVVSHPQYGLLSLEGEYVDYKGSKISYENDESGYYDPFEQDFKQNVTDYYKGAFNVRGGGEYRLMRDIRLRAGVGYKGSPYAEKADQFGADYSKLTFGLGLGYRNEPTNWAFDLGFNYDKSGEANTAYIYNNSFLGAVSDQKTMQLRLNITKRFNE